MSNPLMHETLTVDLGRHLEAFTFRSLLDRALLYVPNDVDKREGSFISDALSPACMELAEMYHELRLMHQAVFVQTAFDSFLDLKVAEQNIIRFPATQAINLAYFEDTDGNPMTPENIPSNAVFSTIHPTDSLSYDFLRPHELAGHYELICQTAGAIGNTWVGNLLPATNINGLGLATMLSNIIPGQDEESDENLRERFWEAIRARAFGGNVIQYRQEVMAIDGVGAVQIYPVWAGGGTVKVVIIDGNLNLVSQEFIDHVQILLDPQSEGLGLGIAPIGHRVTVVTPTAKTVDINVSVDLISGMTVVALQSTMGRVLEEYFVSLRRQWSVPDSFNQHHLSIFRSQVMASLLAMNEVVNVSSVLLNDVDNDIILSQTGHLQELPFLGEVVVNVN